MADLQSLLAERDTASLRLADHRAQLDKQRCSITPDRTEQNRLRGLVAESESELRAIADDIAFERARLASSEQRGIRDAARSKRDAAMKAHRTVITAGWTSIDSKLRALTAEAAALNELATRAATDLTSAAWVHHADADRARQTAGNVVDLVLGRGHAHALAVLLEDLVRALPRAVAPPLAEQHGLPFSVRSPHERAPTLDEASANAQRMLVERCAEWLIEPEGIAS